MRRIVRWWKSRRHDDPLGNRLGDLTLWRSAESDDDYALWAQFSDDPRVADSVDQVKETMRRAGWQQYIGD
ncbi:hypothetical protein GCM10022215_42370 [Nocardioides fonticola]|uniref:Uncharacterized protein n=1 Tax=Nocardioides fonticola TaxID=450363 RepID=A0ABP7Y336_9ACTN